MENADRSSTDDTTSDEAGPNTGPSAVRMIGYIPELDGFRGVAAVLLMAVHLSMVVIPDEEQLPREISGTFLWMDMFFVLSSFLITALLLKEQDKTGRVGIGGFWMRRALRLLPALYAMLAVHYLYAMYIGLDMEIERESIFFTSIYGLNFTMDNIISARVSEGLTQLWSLSVEEQFYVVWPLVVAFVIPLRRKLWVVVSVLVGLIVLVAVRRAIMFEAADGGNWFRLYTHTDTRTDSLLIGALLAYLWVHGRLSTPFVRRYVAGMAWVALLFVTWALFYVTMYDPFAYRGGFVLFALAFAVMILACLETDWAVRRLFRVRWITGLGQVTYGVYLWHMMALLSVMRVGSAWPVWVRVLVAIALTAVATAVSWNLVEKPALRLKDRWDRRRLAAMDAASSSPEAADPRSRQAAQVSE